MNVNLIMCGGMDCIPCVCSPPLPNNNKYVHYQFVYMDINSVIGDTIYIWAVGILKNHSHNSYKTIISPLRTFMLSTGLTIEASSQWNTSLILNLLTSCIASYVRTVLWPKCDFFSYAPSIQGVFDF